MSAEAPARYSVLTLGVANAIAAIRARLLLYATDASFEPVVSLEGANLSVSVRLHFGHVTTAGKSPGFRAPRRGSTHSGRSPNKNCR